MKVSVHRDLCVGYASCMVIAPKAFDVDDDDKVILLDSEPPSDYSAKVQQAARSCPKNAITLESDPID